MVEYPEWLANVVLIPKRDEKVRVCFDYKDLNKVSYKDDFSLPHINMLVDSTASHSILSFMDGFFGYNHILMALEDMKKTSFITKWGTYLLQGHAIWVEEYRGHLSESRHYSVP